MKSACGECNSLEGAAWGCRAVVRTRLAGIRSWRSRTVLFCSLPGLCLEKRFLLPGGVIQAQFEVHFLLGAGKGRGRDDFNRFGCHCHLEWLHACNMRFNVALPTLVISVRARPGLSSPTAIYPLPPRQQHCHTHTALPDVDLLQPSQRLPQVQNCHTLQPQNDQQNLLGDHLINIH